MRTHKCMLMLTFAGLWIFPAVVLTEETISQRGRDKPNLTIHLTLTSVESSGQQGGKGHSTQKKKSHKCHNVCVAVCASRWRMNLSPQHLAKGAKYLHLKMCCLA